MTQLAVDGECIDSWLPVSPLFYEYLVFCLLLLVFGGVMSGLQQGLFQLTEFDLLSYQDDLRKNLAERNRTAAVENGGSPPRRYYADFINFKLLLVQLLKPLITNTHLTLVTLLVGNSLAMETLPIYMDTLMPKHYAILFSVTLLIFVGEILPQALCLKYSLTLTLFFVLPLWLLVILLSPICYPISMFLDYLLGTRNKTYQLLNRAGLSELTLRHSLSNKGCLTVDEIDIILGTLSLSSLTAKDICLPLKNVFMIDYEEEVTDALLREIVNCGHSRIPVYKRVKQQFEDREAGNITIIGVLLTRTLIRVKNVKSSQLQRVKDLQIYPCLKVSMGTPLFSMLTQFRTGKSHLALVMHSRQAVSKLDETKTDRGGAAEAKKPTETEEDVDGTDSRQVCFGIVTLENVIERLIQRPISDEKDRWEVTNLTLENKLENIRKLKTNILNSLHSFHQKDEELGGAENIVGIDSVEIPLNPMRRVDTYDTFRSVHSHRSFRSELTTANGSEDRNSDMDIDLEEDEERQRLLSNITEVEDDAQLAEEDIPRL